MAHSWEVLSTHNLKTQESNKQSGRTGLETTKHGYLYKDAMSAFKDSLKKDNLKKSHFWLGELCISGDVRRAWDVLVDMSVKVLPFVCPMEMTRLYRRMVRMKEKSDRKESSDATVLHILHDTLMILLWAKKQKAVIGYKNVGCYSKVKVPQDARIHRKAPLDSIHPVVLGSLSRQSDPPMLMAAGHEIVHAVLRNDIEGIHFWLSWLILWTPNDFKSKERTHRIKDTKYQKDWIWGLWDLIFALVQHLRLNKNYVKIIQYCQALFTFQFQQGSKKRRYPLLLLCFFLCTNKADKWNMIKELPHIPERIQFGLGIQDFYKLLMSSLSQPSRRP